MFSTNEFSFVFILFYWLVELAIGQRILPSYLANGSCIAPNECTGAILNNLCSGSLKYCIPDTYGSSSYNSLFTLNEVIAASSDNTRIRAIYKYILKPNSVNDCVDKAAYLAQLAHESNGFLSGEELGAETYFSKYEYNTSIGVALGNTQPGDGAKYRGRGFIQITGRSNYENAGNSLNIDLINQPELAAFPSIAGRIAVWYWDKYNLGQVSDGSFYGFSKLTKAINGGLNGLYDRTILLEKTTKILNCGKIFKGTGNSCASGSENGYCKPMCVKGLEGKEYCGCGGNYVKGLCPNDPANVMCCTENCTSGLDLVFVLDSSGSIMSSDFQKELLFVYQVISKLDVGEYATKIGIINFSEQTKVEAYLNSYYDKNALLAKTNSIIQFASSTYTGEALEKCYTLFNESVGMRPKGDGVPRIVMVLTDGQSNGYVPVKTAADKLKSNGISIISVGVGSGVNYNELNDIASDGNVFTLNDFDSILLYIEDLKQVSCKEPAEIPMKTNQISVAKDSFKYFKYSTTSILTDTFYILITQIQGSVSVYTSFTSKNPNNIDQVVDVKRKKRNAESIVVKLQKENSTEVYIGVKGTSEQNKFTLEFTSQLSNNSNKNKYSLMVLSMLLLLLTIKF